MPSFIRPTYKIVMEEFSSWRPCLGCFHSSRRSSPTADIKDRNLRKRLQKFCRISTLKSSNAPIGSADLWSCPNAGSSSAPSHGSIAADGSPRIGRTSTERRSRSCASHQSASCSENSAIRPELSGQTLRPRLLRTIVSRPLVVDPDLGRRFITPRPWEHKNWSQTLWPDAIFASFALHSGIVNGTVSFKLPHRPSREFPSCAWRLTRHSFFDGRPRTARQTSGTVKLLLPPRQSRGISLGY